MLFGLVFISPPFLKKKLLQWFAGARFGPRSQIGWFSAVGARSIEFGAHAELRSLSLIKISGEFKLGDYSEISSFNLAYGSSSLKIGRHSYIGPQCLLNIDEPVTIGDGSALGPRSMVFTHGSFFPYTEGYWVKLAGISLGDRVWCAARVFLHPGAEIGNDCFVNSGSVVAGTIPENSVVEGNPARVIYPLDRVKRKMSPIRVDAALSQILHDFAEIELRRRFGVSPIEESDWAIKFSFNRRPYHVVILRSGDSPEGLGTDNSQLICLVNDPEWVPFKGALILDFTTGATDFNRDAIHTALRLFAKRYYGIKFENQRIAPKSNGDRT